MRINGRQPKGPNKEVVVFERPSEKRTEGDVEETINQDIIFHVQAVLDYSEFDKLYPVPQPPTVVTPGGTNGIRTLDFENKEYKESLTKRAIAQTHWMILKSLEATPGLEWEKVKMGDPNTWQAYEVEFRDAGITAAEANYLIGKVIRVNGLSEQHLDEARMRFLASRPPVSK